MQQPTPQSRAMIWASLWEDEPDPWWVLARSGQVLAYNRAAASVELAPELGEACWGELAQSGLWRGELGTPRRLGIAVACEGQAMLVLPTGGPARGSPLRQALDAAAAAVIGVDQGRVVYRSAGARRWAGRELLGEPTRTALPPTLRSVLAGHGPPPDGDMEAASGMRRLIWRRHLLQTTADGPILLVGSEGSAGPTPPLPRGARPTPPRSPACASRPSARWPPASPTS